MAEETSDNGDKTPQKDKAAKAEDGKTKRTDPFDYRALVSRAIENLPETVKERARFRIPNVEVLFEGKSTIVRNLKDVADTLNRDADHIFSYLLKELGTAGSIEGRRGVFKGRLSTRQINEKLTKYTEAYVLCSECHRPDTKIIKEGRTQILLCEACGAHRPIKVKKWTRSRQPRVEEGGTVEVTIIDIGRKGDGVAKVGNYTIFIPGVAKGSRVKAKVTHVKGKLAFAKSLKVN